MAMGCAARHLAGPVAAGLLAALICGAAPNSNPNPAAAIAAAAGHPARFHLLAQSRREQAGHIEVATLETAGGQRLERQCSDDLCRGTWFDGDHLAAFGINGTPFPDPSQDGPIRTFNAIASTAFGEPEFIAAGGSVAAVSSGEGQLRYRVVAPHGAELIAVADARTSRLSSVEFADGREYRRLVASGSGPALVYATHAYEQVSIASQPLTPPGGPRVDIGPAVEIGLLAADLPIVPCALQGRRLACLIDTGSTPSGVTLDAAEQLGIEPRGQIEIGGLHPYLTGVVEAGPLVLGNATVSQLRFAVIPRMSAARFDVLLGSDALAGLCISFEVGHRRVTLSASGGEPRSRPIAIDFNGGLPYTAVKLGHRTQSEPMLLDTGDTETLAIGYDEYREDTTLFAVRTMAAATGASSGSMDILQGELEHADIGGEPIDGVPISAVRGEHVGHVGFGFVARCGNFRVDLGARRIECGTAAQAQRTSTGDP